VREIVRSMGRGRRSGGGGRVTASSLRVVALTAVVAAALLALTAGSASAARGHVFDPTLTLGVPCATAPCGPGELKEPSAVAVNEATHQVYVLDQGNDRVEVFDGETGTVEGEIKEFEVSPVSEPGVKTTFSFPAAPQNGALAIDNSSGGESAGDVYVADAEHGVVDKFNSAGTYLGQIVEANGEPLSSEQLNAVAVDLAGGLWIYRGVASPSVDGFTGAEPNVFAEVVVIPGLLNFAESGLAVDSHGSFYTRRSGSGVNGGSRISKFSHTGAVLKAEVDTENSSAVAVEHTSDTAFVDNFTSIRSFDPASNELEQLGEEGGEHILFEGAGIGVDAATGFLYVADHAAGHVIAFEPELPGAPTVEPGSNFVSAVTSNEATLNAEVNPRSEAGNEPTTYYFEYGPCTTALTCGSSPYGSLTSSGSLVPDFEAHPASLVAPGLQPGTTYHYRAVAENSHDPGAPVRGEEGIFATQTSGALVLPDSRQWQLVSPAHKLGAKIEPIFEIGVVQAAVGGGAITYIASTPTEPEPAGYPFEQQILSTRGGSGWSTRDLGIPHVSASGKPVGEGLEYRFFNPELSLAAVQPFGEFDPVLSPEASESTAVLRDLSGLCGSSCYQPLVTAKEGIANVPAGTSFGEEAECSALLRNGRSTATACGPRFLGASEDLDHVVLRPGGNSAAELTPGAGVQQLFEWSGGALSQVSLLPEGEAAVPGTTALGLEDFAARGAISSDGSRVFWSAKASGAENLPNLYLRYNATRAQSAVTAGQCTEATMGCTIQLDAAEPACLAAGECESGGGRFQFASSDGSRVFFTDVRALAEGSGAEAGNSEHPARPDLYECRIVTEAGGQSCELTDLTPRTTGNESATVLGGVLGAARDGSSVYFVADGVLAANAVDNGAGTETAQPGKPNLYLRHGTTTSFTTTLGTGDNHDWGEILAGQPTRVSNNGRWLALMSERPLTGNDNRDLATGQPVAEVYLYDAGSGRLVCASCEPSGARPVGVEYEKLKSEHGGLVGQKNGWSPTGLVAANVPGWTAFSVAAGSRYQNRYLSDSGRLFFNTADPLVPQDSNGTQDVYEYEPPGVGSCTEASPTFGPRSGGCVNLISSGTSGEESAFLDASEDGDDVFFLTASRLVPQDEDAALDVYDAHSCEAPEGCLSAPPPPPPACEGDACQQPATPPVDATPGSLTFNGAGNVKECPKGKQLKKGKCAKKQTKKKHHKKSKHHKTGKKSPKAKKPKRTAGKSQGDNK
jgi:DNA-binding beta-propeller fold protein YncE